MKIVKAVIFLLFLCEKSLVFANIPLGIVPVLVAEMEKSKYTYVVKILDTNGDGIDDLYVTGGPKRKVGDFIIERRADSNYKIIDTVTSAQQKLAKKVSPSDSIAVIRQDYNGDALYDFQIFNVDEAIENEFDFIVTTTFGKGDKPVKVIPMDYEFFNVLSWMEHVFINAHEYVEIYDKNENKCWQIFIPYSYYDKENDEWVDDYIYYEGCVRGRDMIDELLPKEPSYFISALTAMNNEYNLNYMQNTGTLYNDLVSGVDLVKILDSVTNARKAVRWVRNGSIVATVIILADDVSVIGVADDVGLIATLPAWGIAVIADIVLSDVIGILQTAIEEGDLDVGHTDQAVGVGSGTFTIPDNCDPKMPGQIPSGGNKYSSRRLRKNLSNTNCWCKDQNVTGVAHHIVPKKSSSFIGYQLLQCTEDKGIDIDSAVNGVCLPGIDTEESDALLHSGNNGHLHGKEVLEILYDKCQNSNKEQFEAYLRQTAARYT